MAGATVALWLSAGLFCLAIVGVILRRNTLSSFLSFELMICSAILALTAFDFARAPGSDVAGRGFAVMVYSVAIAQAFVGLALLIARRRSSRALGSGSC
jgi:NADH-quinone oxidoreductase subunit K